MTFWREQWKPGDVAWFEYHCLESDASADAKAWHRSHQQVTVLSEGDNDAWPGSTFTERGQEGVPKNYTVRFADGLQWTVFEDELMTSQAGFERPNPPDRTGPDLHVPGQGLAR